MSPTVFRFSFNIGNNGFDVKLGKCVVFCNQYLTLFTDDKDGRLAFGLTDGMLTRCVCEVRVLTPVFVLRVLQPCVAFESNAARSPSRYNGELPLVRQGLPVQVRGTQCGGNYRRGRRGGALARHGTFFSPGKSPIQTNPTTICSLSCLSPV
jgi:hypothetical protein